jgi:alpha-L-fucosidase
MARHRESIVRTEPGLAPWQFYRPSTRRGDRTFLHLLMRPCDAVSVRGVPLRRVRGVRVAGTDAPLPWSSRVAVTDRLLNADPLGELRITAPGTTVDPCATVIAVDAARRSSSRAQGIGAQHLQIIRALERGG